MLKLSDIFVPLPRKRTYTREALLDLPLQPTFILAMAEKHNLNFRESAPSEPNLCFLESPELRPEYKSAFSKADVVAYIFAVLSRPEVHMDSDQVPFPASALGFWMDRGPVG